MKKPLLLLITGLFLIVVFLLPLKGFSVFRWEIEYPWEPPQPGNLPEYVVYIYRFAIWGSGIVAMLMIIIGGVLYMTSMEDPEKKKDARDRIKSALFGLLLLFGIYIILNTINPELTIARLPQVRPAPDMECLGHCHDLCQRQCQDQADACLDYWKKGKDYPVKAGQEGDARLACDESCYMTCRSICQYVCAKNYWEWKCDPNQDAGANIWCHYDCKTRALSLTSQSCLYVCGSRELGLYNCSGGCFVGSFPVTALNACPAACLDAYQKTCDALKK